MANSEIVPEEVDWESLKATIKSYIVDILDDADSTFEEILPSFFGNGDTEKLRKIQDQLEAAGIVKKSTRMSAVGKV